MRILSPAPSSLHEGGEPRYGSYGGALPRLALEGFAPSWLERIRQEKRWVYVAVADARVLVGVAVVGLGYASNAIVFALDRRAGQMLVDRSFVGGAAAARFTDDGPLARGARFEARGVRVEIGDGALTADLRGVDGRRVFLGARFEPVAAPAIGAFVPVVGGRANATEKRIARAEGEVVAGGQRVVLDDALAAFDHTHGLLARHTAWRWALGLGRASDGRLLAFNLVEGFVGEAECAAWLGDELVPLGEGRFEYDLARPMEPWRVRTTCGGLDLRFDPAAVHAERKNLGVVRSEFLQPAGRYTGRLVVRGETVDVDVPGVSEHQDVRW